MPGWPLPTFCTASMASTRTVSTARSSVSVQSSFATCFLSPSACSWAQRLPRSRAVAAGLRVPARAFLSLLTSRSRLDPAATSQYVARHVTSDTYPEEPRDPRRADGRLLRRPLDGWSPQAVERATWRDVVAAYVGLTKPRIIELLLLTTVPVMFFAAARRAAARAGRRDRRRRHAVGRRRQRAQLRLRPRHRRADAAYPSPGAAAAHRLAACRRLVFGLVLGVLATLVLGSSGSTGCRRCWRCGRARSTSSSTR